MKTTIKIWRIEGKGQSVKGFLVTEGNTSDLRPQRIASNHAEAKAGRGDKVKGWGRLIGMALLPLNVIGRHRQLPGGWAACLYGSDGYLRTMLPWKLSELRGEERFLSSQAEKAVRA